MADILQAIFSNAILWMYFFVFGFKFHSLKFVQGLMWQHGNIWSGLWLALNSSSPGQNGRHFADGIFKCISSKENVSILIKILLKFVPKGPIDNKSALVQIMAWCQIGDRPLSEPMLTHTCSTRGRWVKKFHAISWTVLPQTSDAIWQH